MNKSFNISLLSKYPNRILWNMNKSCNLRCEYCYYQGTESNYTDTNLNFSPIKIKNSFDATGKIWLILLSGGEPFLYPNIYQVIHELTEKHTLQITTNLIACDTAEFINAVRPESIMTISASYHVMSKIDQSQKDLFIKKYHKLKEAGFSILVNYAAYPPLFTRIEEDISYLKDKGIENVTILSFRGIYNNKTYPGSYTNEELSIIKKHSIDDSELIIAKAKTNFYRHYCNAGKHYFSMDMHGNITRCGTIGKSYGNIFNGNFLPNDMPKPCTTKLCIDCYLGLVAVQNKKANIFSTFIETLKHKK